MSAPFLNPTVYDYFLHLPLGSSVLAEYFWLGGSSASGGDLRSKTKTIKIAPEETVRLDHFPVWNFDGSSTGQAEGNDSEVFLQPVAFYRDPFRPGRNFLVLCECCKPNMEPCKTNTRRKAAEVMERASSAHPWFGLEQEYTLYEADGRTPLGWPRGGFPSPQGDYYCSVGTENAFGRRVVDSHYRACIYAGLTICGVNGEVLPSQWEFQLGPLEGIAASDELWAARFLLKRICEEFCVRVSFDPKPIPGNWNGSGCHTNFSTAAMREAGGLKEIVAAIEKLGKKHEEHIKVYGAGNERRLTGAHETASINKFSYGIADRGASIRIPRQAAQDDRGYFEDRRPAANMDPYKVTAKIVETTILL